MIALKTIFKFYFQLIMKTSDRKKLEYRVTEKLIAMIQTNDLDRISIFLSDFSPPNVTSISLLLTKGLITCG